mmetsp:Transcript_139741/g.445940  ORF Transcript_139741/g.445940 Transcript_139741/m.445940 type:complete len:110 (-) Transcript_139741:131-460(-)
MAKFWQPWAVLLRGASMCRQSIDPLLHLARAALWPPPPAARPTRMANSGSRGQSSCVLPVCAGSYTLPGQRFRHQHQQPFCDALVLVLEVLHTASNVVELSCSLQMYRF